MKTLKFSLLFAIVVIVMSSCDKGETITASGPITEVEKTFSGFTSIESSNGFELVLRFGETEKVIIETNESLQPYIEVNQAGDKLVINRTEDVDFEGNYKVRIYIYAKTMNSLSTSGGTVVTAVDIVETNDLSFDFSGGGSFIGTLKCNSVDANLSGGSSLNASGTTGTFTLNSTGGSEMGGFDFSVDEFHCNITGGGVAKLTVNEKLYVNATGGSNIYYKGAGTIESQSLSGGSAITKL